MNRPALLVTGATGLLGSALAARREILPLARRDPGGGAPWWEPDQGRVHDDGRPIGAVVHLAGAGIADERWTTERKRLIRDSRVLGSRTLVEWLRHRPQRPSVLIATSAVGIYGDRGDEELTEDSPPGQGFLATVGQEWEAEVHKAGELGVRVVLLRLGIVLSTRGGALAKMLPAFRAGAGGPMGSGRQWFPWVHVDDVVGVIDAALSDPRWSGVYNVVAPGALRQKDFARSLGRVLRRPAILPAPAFALRAAFGEMADEALLASDRVRPARLQEQGYAFRFPDLDPALRDLLR